MSCRHMETGILDGFLTDKRRFYKNIRNHDFSS